MATQIFVNLPVKDLTKSIAFFTQLGYTFNPQFTDENATCMVISDTIFVMLLVEPFFRRFTKKKIADATTVTESIICLSADSRQGVDELADKALAAGGSVSNEPQDEGFMYSRSFQDVDGHLWEIMYMEPGAANQEPPTTEASAA
ncbi:VOC family protein [Spirosoma agri]|uniref:VOC family protein n=1 Tax=Spirosoma agri TaxID=1987381 RepID=A0A6M0IKD2_9BACT|nr:VOC family protein [Spirosoma agri]NEU68085.1 VOC family protein [Spirosoma agri]